MIDGSEMVLLGLAFCLVFLYARWTFASTRLAALLTTATLPALYLAIEGSSQFLTVDETYSVPEAIDLSSSMLTSWLQGGLRTTDAIIGLSMAVVRAFVPATVIQSYELAKLGHWLIGFIALLAIHRLLDRHWVPSKHRVAYFVVYTYLALLLPVNALSLKVFNYDALSESLAVLTLLQLVVAVRTARADLAGWCIVVATLAAQEKLVASPLVLISVSTFAYLRSASEPRLSKLKRAAASVLVGYSLAVLISLLSLLVVVWFKGPNLIPIAALVVFDPVTSWLWPAIEFAFGVGSGLRFVSPFPLVAVSALAAYVLAIAMILVTRFKSVTLSRLAYRLEVANLAAAVVVFALGAYGTNHVVSYWAPYAPIPPGSYHPTTTMNGAVWHFGAQTRLQHVVSFVAFAYAVFVNAVPSVFWLILVGVGLLTLLTGSKTAVPLSISLFLTVGLAFPLAFGLLQVPVGSRYLSLGLFTMAMAITLWMGRFLAPLAQWKQLTAAGVVAGLLVLEVVPFRPVYGAFRPIWSNEDATASMLPAPGRNNPSWLGWGEEAMLAGREVLSRCASGTATGEPAQNCASLRLHLAYPGYWLVERPDVRQVLMGEFMKGMSHRGMLDELFVKDDFQYTAQDYYILNRASIVQQAWKFPTAVPPDFVVEFRGFVEAWVFRGDRLQAANFHFEAQ
jgi:hypothetical protein